MDLRKLSGLLWDEIVALEVIVLCVAPEGGEKSDLRDLGKGKGHPATDRGGPRGSW